MFKSRVVFLLLTIAPVIDGIAWYTSLFDTSLFKSITEQDVQAESASVASLGCELTRDETLLVQFQYPFRDDVKYLTRAGVPIKDAWDGWRVMHAYSVRTAPAAGYRKMILAVNGKPGWHAKIFRGTDVIPSDHTIKGTYYFCVDSNACPGAKMMKLCENKVDGQNVGMVATYRFWTCGNAQHMMDFFSYDFLTKSQDPLCPVSGDFVSCPDNAFENLVQYRAPHSSGLNGFKYLTAAGQAMGDNQGWQWMISYFVRRSPAAGFRQMDLIRNTLAPYQGYFQPPGSIPHGFQRVGYYYVCTDKQYCVGFINVRACNTNWGSFLTCAASCPAGSDQISSFYVGVQGHHGM